MTYADLPAGAAVFVDASVLIHHFEPNALSGPAATAFLERIENQEMNGLTATHIVSEVAHRLMTLEAMQAFGWKSAGIALRLRNHPTQVQNTEALSSSRSGNPALRYSDSDDQSRLA